MPYEIVIQDDNNSRFYFQTREELNNIIEKFEGYEYYIYSFSCECLEHSLSMDSYTGECLQF